MSQEKDQQFFRNFTLVVATLAVLMIIFIILARSFGIRDDSAAGRAQADIDDRTQPIGRVVQVGEEEAVEQTLEEAPEMAVADMTTETKGDQTQSGEQVYEGLCVNCHGIDALASMIPQTGDKSVWADRIDKGIEVLYDHAINGFNGEMGIMPARGGNPDLSDAEVKAAVDYMVAQSQ